MLAAPIDFNILTCYIMYRKILIKLGILNVFDEIKFFWKKYAIIDTKRIIHTSNPRANFLLSFQKSDRKNGGIAWSQSGAVLKITWKRGWYIFIKICI
jgi:hypothetical protein